MAGFIESSGSVMDGTYEAQLSSKLENGNDSLSSSEDLDIQQLNYDMIKEGTKQRRRIF